ncbi:hypothetical protein FN846DRAFT_896257 [Sphaerosporella brunnea]|uniref:Uncharacterized protein n=1 Tax=Sphaerosporella brunnea TaxID=1250544 RepID=A0A5J5ED05_9PEZI|nr:hypothetical protein FN846DRAFT_896257 [Sphaerosporella brunnea]
MTTTKLVHKPSPPHTSHKRSRSLSPENNDDDEYSPTPCPRASKKTKTNTAGSGTAADPIDLTGDDNSDSESNDKPAPAVRSPSTAANPLDTITGAPLATPSEEELWLRRNFPRRRPNTMSGMMWTTFWPASPPVDKFGRIWVGRSCYYDDADNCKWWLFSSGQACCKMLTLIVVRDLDDLAKPVPGAPGRADFGRASLRTRLNEAGIYRPIVRVLEERELGFFRGWRGIGHTFFFFVFCFLRLPRRLFHYQSTRSGPHVELAAYYPQRST